MTKDQIIKALEIMPSDTTEVVVEHGRGSTITPIGEIKFTIIPGVKPQIRLVIAE